ncbi:MAG: non-homologous end-joining DNA ligase [Actinomycetota bacterium]|nr:non-homologous end-joining DNA ligase [Actinomycetota bacterium]
MADPLPRNLQPMLATPAAAPPEGAEWAFEIKWDGVRALAYVEGGALRVSSRRGEDTSARYPELTGLADALGGRSAILDGEIVAFDAGGRPSFQTLQLRMGLTRPETIRRRAQEVPVSYVAFDLVNLDGESLMSEPYERRRELLAVLGLDSDYWRAPAHRIGEGGAFLAAARAQGLEGIVCKRLGSPYRPGRRSADWQKIRARLRQELVVGAYMPGEGGRSGSVGSLLVGFWDRTPAEAASTGSSQRLVYAGGVGTGFTDEMLKRLRALLEPLRLEEMPFELGEDPRLKYRGRARARGAGPVWVEPLIVCEVEFTEWTHEGTLRQPSFKALRDDKVPLDVVRET